jgi:dTDP-4-dehydrorhamnose 3,5-epimerase
MTPFNGSEIADVTVRRCDPIEDLRGSLCEVHHDDWTLAPRPLQWDVVRSKASVLRGVHVHRLRWDYIVVVDGHATIGLSDVRRDSESFGRGMVVDCPPGQPVVVTIPPGVAHGIYAGSPLVYMYGLTVPYNGADADADLGCRFDDPALGVTWPSASPVLVARDLELPDLATLVLRYNRASS